MCMDVLYSCVAVDVEAFRSLGVGIRKTKEERKKKKFIIFLVITNAL